MSNKELMQLSNTQIIDASTEELKKALTQGLSITSKMLAYLAKIWKELEKRGEDLRGLKSGLATYLPLIGEDKLDPEVVVKFAGKKTVLDRLISLPIKDQRKLLEEGSIEYVKLGENRERVIEKTPITLISPTQAKQIFKDGKIATPDEQFAELVQQKPERKKNNKRRIARKAVVEQIDEDELLTVSGKRIKMENVIAALSVHYGVTQSDINKALNRYKPE